MAAYRLTEPNLTRQPAHTKAPSALVDGAMPSKESSQQKHTENQLLMHTKREKHCRSTQQKHNKIKKTVGTSVTKEHTTEETNKSAHWTNNANQIHKPPSNNNVTRQQPHRVLQTRIKWQ